MAGARANMLLFCSARTMRNSKFHNLIRKHMVMHFVLGDFYPGHSEEVAGGKYFALMKPNADGAPIQNARGASVDANVRGIVIGSVRGIVIVPPVQWLSPV